MRLFLLLGTLVAFLVAAEWWLVRTLARDLSTEIGEVAFRVGESVVASVTMKGGTPDWHGLTRADENMHVDLTAPGGSLTRRFVFRTEDGEMKTVEQRDERLGDEPDVARASGTLVHALGDASHALEGLSPEETFLLLQALEELRGEDGPFPAAPRVSVLDEQGRELEGEERRAALEDGEAELVLRLDSPFDSRFLTLSGGSFDERIPIPREGVDEALARFFERLLAGSGALLLAGLALAALVAHRATAPLRELSRAAKQLGEGALGTQVQVQAAGEVGDAVVAFNGMSRRLAELDEQTRTLSEEKHLGEMGEVARGLAHGLRNPMNALGLSVDELAIGELDESRRTELTESARRQIRRVDQSIRSFLALAASGTESATQEVEVAGLIEDVVLEVLQDARGRVQVSAEPGDGRARVHAVPAELRALVQALLVNASEASPDGERVVARVLPGDGPRVRIEVEDAGPGLPASVRERLFQPHVTTKSSGAGMGLFLAHRIATTRLGGELRLEDRPGGGTLAVLELPLSEESTDV